LCVAPASAAPGALDAGFGTEGRALLGPPVISLGAVAVQPDGRVVVGGVYPKNGAPTWVVARYNANGSADTSFGTGGRVDVGLAGWVVDIALMPDGRIVTMGTMTAGTRAALLRLRPDGSRDPSFGTNGAVESTRSRRTAYALAVDAQGRSVITGNGGGENGEELMLERFTADGKVDNSFGGDGLVLHKLHTSGTGNSGSTWGQDVGFDSAGKLVASGQTLNPDTENGLFVGRFRDDGSPDTSWGGDGFATVPTATGGSSSGNLLAMLSGGRIALVGSQDLRAGEEAVRIARFDANGNADASFGPGGIRTYPLREADLKSSAAAPGGRTLVSGTTELPDNSDLGFALRLSPDGELDPAWGSSGVTTWPATLGSYPGRDIEATPDGGAVVGQDVDAPEGVEGELVKLTGDNGNTPAPGGGSGGGGGGGDNPPAGGAEPALLVGTPVMRRGRLLIRMRCRTTERCRGAVKATRGKRTLSRSAFSIPSGKSRRVALRVGRRPPRRVRLTILLRAPVRDLVTGSVRLR
jgi:uncharacterized delta-60 repeat protein